MNRFIVMSRSAKMPTSCWGKYARVAVVETDLPEGEPRMISPRSRGVVRIVATWERLNTGITEKTAFARAMVEAKALAAELNRKGRRVYTRVDAGTGREHPLAAADWPDNG